MMSFQEWLEWRGQRGMWRRSGNDQRKSPDTNGWVGGNPRYSGHGNKAAADPRNHPEDTRNADKIRRRRDIEEG